jgi:hypothetical protein
MPAEICSGGFPATFTRSKLIVKHDMIQFQKDESRISGVYLDSIDLMTAQFACLDSSSHSVRIFQLEDCLSLELAMP